LSHLGIPALNEIPKITSLVKNLIFCVRGKRLKMFLAENIFMENDFSKIIFRLKSFYVEVNRALGKFKGKLLVIGSLVVCCQGKKIRREEEKMESWLVSLVVFEHSDWREEGKNMLILEIK
jgi:hypothetical protein